MMKSAANKAVFFALLLSTTGFADNVEAASNVLSEDGRYAAILVGKYPDVHYEVKDQSSGTSLFTTHAKYKTANDVKAGIFLFNSRLFAAAYHYGHKGQFTWIGIWDMRKKYRIQGRREKGWIRDLSFLSNDQNLRQYYGSEVSASTPQVFYFKAECPSKVDPCDVVSMGGKDANDARIRVRSLYMNCRISQITQAQYYDKRTCKRY